MKVKLHLELVADIPDQLRSTDKSALYDIDQELEDLFTINQQDPSRYIKIDNHKIIGYFKDISV